MRRLFSHVAIQSISSVLPKEVVSLAEFSAMYGEKTAEKICKATGIQAVRCAPADKTSADYCMEAARHIFASGVISPKEIDGLVFVSETPDYVIPHTSAALQEKLGLPNQLIAYDINYGCAGYVYGLFQASLLIETGYCRHVLLCVGDTETRFIHPRDKALRMVIGDAGSATLVSATDEERLPSGFSFHTDGSGADALMIPAGGCRTPRVAGVTDVCEEDGAGNARSQENLYMDGMRVMAYILKGVRPTMRSVLQSLDLDENKVDLYAVHQANAFIVKKIAKLLHVETQRVPFAAEHVGNTSCASIPVMLCNAYSGKHEILRRVMVCGFGTGFSCAAGMVDLSCAEIFPLQEM